MLIAWQEAAIAAKVIEMNQQWLGGYATLTSVAWQYAFNGTALIEELSARRTRLDVDGAAILKLSTVGLNELRDGSLGFDSWMSQANDLERDIAEQIKVPDSGLLAGLASGAGAAAAAAKDASSGLGVGLGIGLVLLAILAVKK